MNKQHNLIVQYLKIMQEQENIINELGKSNIQLVNRNNELKKQNKMYKENTIYWKTEHDKLQKYLMDGKVQFMSIRDINAIKAYRENQCGNDMLLKEISEYMNNNMEHNSIDFKEIDIIRRCKNDEKIVSVKVGALKRVMNDIEKERQKILDMLLRKQGSMK